MCVTPRLHMCPPVICTPPHPPPPPLPSQYILQNDSLRLTTEQCWYHPLQAVDASHVSMQYFLREVSFGSYSSADVFCIVNGNLGQDERGEVHLYHRDCSLKDYVLLTL